MAGDAARVAAVLDEVYAAGSVPTENGDLHPLEPVAVERPEGESLRDLALAEGATRTIEVGLALGLSALFLGEAILRSGAGGAQHVAIDPFQRPYFGNAGLLLIERAGLGGVVEFVEEDSKTALPRMAAAGEEFDLAFVDGDHKFESVFADLLYMTRLVKPGGVIVVDDMWMPAVRLAVSYFERNLRLQLLPDATPFAFRWTARRPWSREVCPGRGDYAVLRQPVEPVERSWDDFVPFS